MKKTAKKAIRDETGGALVLTLVLLLVGGLIIAPLLGFIGTGTIAGGVHEKRMDELYAADAGVEKAFWYIVSEGYIPSEDSLTANEKEVDIYIEKDVDGCRTYRVTSIATTEGVSSTTVEAYIAPTSFLDNAITSRGDVNLGNDVSVEGTIQHGGSLNVKEHTSYDPAKTINEKYANWPSSDELYDYYDSKYVQNEAGFHFYDPGHEIKELGTKEEPLAIGPAFARGDLEIKGSGWIRLDGTIYVDGTLKINPSGQGIHIILDRHVVFAEQNIDIGTGGNGVNLYGSGSFIAKGDIDFKPNASSEDGYVLVLSLTGNVNFQPTGDDFTGFIMSVNKTVNFQPRGTFFGSVVGDLNVALGSSVKIQHVPRPDADIDFPFADYLVWRIQNWNISLQTEAE